jgi:hypothetical protein
MGEGSRRAGTIGAVEPIAPSLTAMTIKHPHPHLFHHAHTAALPHDVEYMPAVGDPYAYHGGEYRVTAVTPSSYYNDARIVTLDGPSGSVEWALVDFLSDNGWWPILPEQPVEE